MNEKREKGPENEREKLQNELRMLEKKTKDPQNEREKKKKNLE